MPAFRILYGFLIISLLDLAYFPRKINRKKKMISIHHEWQLSNMRFYWISGQKKPLIAGRLSSSI